MLKHDFYIHFKKYIINKNITLTLLKNNSIIYRKCS
jgi:hypothetical protein